MLTAQQQQVQEAAQRVVAALSPWKPLWSVAVELVRVLATGGRLLVPTSYAATADSIPTVGAACSCSVYMCKPGRLVSRL